jgi:hypothetical protein
VQPLAFFGLVARGETRPDSDVDLMVEFNRPVGLFGLIALQQYLEKILRCAVDLRTTDSLKEDVRLHVLADCAFLQH